MTRVGMLALLAVALTAACTRAPLDGPASVESVVAEPTMQPEDMVDLTVYFRSGEGSDAFLVPVTKETDIDDELPRRAVELLIAGPTEGDGRGLSGPLPTSTQVLGLHIDGETAFLDLSRHVITQAEEVNPSAEHEALALAAIVGTLAEFPVIEQVRLSVEGEQRGSPVSGVDVGAFWGGWGLPAVLVPDDGAMSEPSEGEGVPDLERFTTDPQEVGSSTDARLAVTRVRPRDRTTYLRIIVELENMADPDASTPVPPARVHLTGDAVVVDIDGVAEYDADVSPGERLELDNPAFEDVAVDIEHDGRVRIAVSPAPAHGFWLHTLSNPTRIVLDLRK